MTTPKVKTASPDEIDRCIVPIVAAFRDDPVVRWLYPDADDFDAFFPELVRISASEAAKFGTAYYIEDGAAALWLPPDAEPDEDAGAALIEKSMPSGHRDAVFALFERMEAAHPDEPHWYLPFIGVDPERQGSGLGAALLNHTLDICDGLRICAHLEATSPSNVRLYERHGFEAGGTVEFGGSPPLTPMLRKARASA